MKLPVQYFTRANTSPPDAQQEVKLHRLSLRRKSTLVAISLLVAITCISIEAVLTVVKHASLEQRAQISTTNTTVTSILQDAVRSNRNRELILSTLSLIPILIVVFILVRAGPRIIELEHWIRRMGSGDLTHTVSPTGNDEITEVAYDLEVLRRRSVRAQQLDLVQQLSENLQDKNQELEDTLQQLHRTQDQMVSRQKLVELGELAAGVAHEISNPLNFISNFSQGSQQLMEELQDTLPNPGQPLTPEQHELVQELAQDLGSNMTRLQEHTNRAQRIVHEMLAMGRNSTGAFQDTDINQLVHDNLNLAYQATRAGNPDFNITIQEDLDPGAGSVTAVPEDLGRVFLNIVSNACYAVGERTRQTPPEEDYQPTLQVSTRRTPEDIQVRITDNGAGMTPEVMERIFSPFFTTKPANRGTGLGLSLCSDIVRQHAGSITPESEPGHHTTMLVNIPSGPRQAPDPQEDTQDDAQEARPRNHNS